MSDLLLVKLRNDEKSGGEPSEPLCAEADMPADAEVGEASNMLIIEVVSTAGCEEGIEGS